MFLFRQSSCNATFFGLKDEALMNVKVNFYKMCVLNELNSEESVYRDGYPMWSS